MMAHISFSQPTREYGIENNVARFADKAPSISYTQKTSYKGGYCPASLAGL